MSHMLAFGNLTRTASPLEGFLDKSGLNLLFRAVTVKRASPSSVKLLCMEWSVAAKNADRTGPRLVFTALNKLYVHLRSVCDTFFKTHV